jgi:hypothetical protein
MENLCFTERSLQFSKFTHKSLGNPFSSSPLFFLSLALILSSTDGTSPGGFFPCSPSLYSLRLARSRRRPGARGARRGWLTAGRAAPSGSGAGRRRRVAQRQEQEQASCKRSRAGAAAARVRGCGCCGRSCTGARLGSRQRALR